MKSAMAIEVEPPRRLWSIDEYQRMIDTGILTERDRVELVHGEIVHTTPIGHRHAAAALLAVLNRRLADRVLVLRPRADFYRWSPRARRTSCW